MCSLVLAYAAPEIEGIAYCGYPLLLYRSTPSLAPTNRSNILPLSEWTPMVVAASNHSSFLYIRYYYIERGMITISYYRPSPPHTRERTTPREEMITTGYPYLNHPIHIQVHNTRIYPIHRYPRICYYLTHRPPRGNPQPQPYTHTQSTTHHKLAISVIRV